MFEYKLQIGCLIIVIYLIVSYIKGTSDRKVKCNPIFDKFMYLVPWAIIFDGITAWTVNHLDIVPLWVNLLCHGLFLFFMSLTNQLTFNYMLYQTVGIKNRKWHIIVNLPGFFVILAFLLTLNKLVYIQGVRTNYSMGVPVIICYSSMFIHSLAILIIMIVRRRTLEKRKILGIFSFMIISIGVFIAQIIYPEILLSSIVPTVIIFGIYMSFEDPSFRRLQQYNADMVTGFATLVENRDDNTGGHIIRTQAYVKILLEQMEKHNRYQKILTKDYVTNVINAAPMHDIGKISTPDYILQKPGKLTAEEYEIMKKHAAQGGEIIKRTFSNIDEPEYQKITYEVARFHHEKWNGKGYPDGLKEKQIPLHSRIMAIADVFDAVSAKRCYRDAMPLETCFKIIEEGRGQDFDPDLVDLFLEAKDEVIEMHRLTSD